MLVVISSFSGVIFTFWGMLLADFFQSLPSFGGKISKAMPKIISWKVHPRTNEVKSPPPIGSFCNRIITGVNGEGPSGLFSLRQVTEVKLGRVRSDSGRVTSEA